MSQRRYNDPCGIARGVGLVGERWALLVVRELILGPKRFSDLQRGLPTASPNVLSQRLRELERDGVVSRRRLGPPASAIAYELTDWGRQLEPVIYHLGVWGSQAPVTATADIGLDSLVLALRDRFDATAAGDLRCHWELRVNDHRFHASIADGTFTIARGEATAPDAVVTADFDALKTMVFGDDPNRRELLTIGRVTAAGDPTTLAKLAAAFTVPGC
jgi:DNA-binding HxlR family transcriptional regulator